MGLMGRIFGAGAGVGARTVGEAVTGVAEVFVGNRADRDAAAAAAFAASLGQYGAEFTTAPCGRFDGFVNGLNRLPRPMLAIGTFGLFGYAMAEPAGFSVRMQGLGHVPEPLWWLLGAIVSFYFGARELHYRREGFVTIPVTRRPGAAPGEDAASAAADPAPDPAPLPVPAPAEDDMPAATPVVAAPATAAPRSPAESAPAQAADYNAPLEEWRRLRA